MDEGLPCAFSTNMPLLYTCIRHPGTIHVHHCTFTTPSPSLVLQAMNVGVSGGGGGGGGSSKDSRADKCPQALFPAYWSSLDYSPLLVVFAGNMPVLCGECQFPAAECPEAGQSCELILYLLCMNDFAYVYRCIELLCVFVIHA